LKEIREQVKLHLEQAIVVQAIHYNKQHHPKEYAVGDRVLLSIKKNLRSFRLNKKLDFLYEESFKVIEKIGKQAYRLRLPADWRRIHPVFHMSLLEPYYQWKGEESKREPQAIKVNDQEEWEIKTIVNHYTYWGQTKYLVK
jgi:hypothetical protein